MVDKETEAAQHLLYLSKSNEIVKDMPEELFVSRMVVQMQRDAYAVFLRLELQLFPVETCNVISAGISWKNLNVIIFLNKTLNIYFIE